MKFLATYRDKSEAGKLISVLNEAEPDAIVISASSFEEAMKLMKDNIFDVAFIDPECGKKIKAAEFALTLKNESRDTHIIFVSKSQKYMSDAFSVHADAYLIKPVTPDDIRRETDYLMNHYPAPLRSLEVTVRTFGGFNVFVRGRRLLFKRSKAKELLAILVDNRGIGLTTREACSMLFDGRPYDEILLGYFHVVLTSLKTTLEENGIRNMIRKSMNYIAINPDVIDCDMYRYLRGEPDALSNYHGDYMTGYSWSDYSVSPLAEKKEAMNA